MLLFISYAREDTDRIRELVEILRDGGHEPWFDHRLVVGQDWREQLEEIINKCDAFVYALTPHSIESEWCQWEFSRASELGKPIIPILMDKASAPMLPEAIKRRQYADFTEGMTGRAVAKLLRGLQKVASIIPPKEVPAPPPIPSGVPSRAVHTDETLYLEALRIANQNGGISINLLIEQLRIGYPRAKRLIQRMENEGKIGAYAGGGRLRPLIKP